MTDSDGETGADSVPTGQDDERERDAATEELALARALVLKAHPEAVSELVQGATLAELLASVPAAEAAYRRIADAARQGASVPGGGVVRTAPVSVDGLGPLAKIRAGVRRG